VTGREWEDKYKTPRQVARQAFGERLPETFDSRSEKLPRRNRSTHDFSHQDRFHPLLDVGGNDAI